MKVYTKKGDQGTTGLIGGTRILKSSLRIEAYGTVDELNAHIGLLRDLAGQEELENQLLEIQDRLFTIGSSLACDPAKESGLKIPGDIAVASFNDIPVAQFLNPPLTTVRLPAEEIGQNAVDLLFEQLSGRSTPKCILLSSRVILRASTRGKGKSGVK